MFNLIDWKETQFYKDAFHEGEIEGEARGEAKGEAKGESIGQLKGEIKGKIKGKLETIPLLLRLGLTPEQIAQELNLDLDIITDYIQNKNN